MTSTSRTTRRRIHRTAHLASAPVETPTKTSMWWLAHAASLVVAAVFLAAPAHADVDTDFANQLHTYGIYGPKDYNAWIGKIACKRLSARVDQTAFASAAFLTTNLARTATTQQVWQFLGADVATYCPEQTPVLQSAADSSAATIDKEHG